MDDLQHAIYKLSRMATRTVFQPQLKFVNVTIILNDKSFEVKALMDSGCAKTAISYKLFQNLQKHCPSLKQKNFKCSDPNL